MLRVRTPALTRYGQPDTPDAWRREKKGAVFHLNSCSAAVQHFTLTWNTHTQPDLSRVHHLAAADRHQAALSIYLSSYTPSSSNIFVNHVGSLASYGRTLSIRHIIMILVLSPIFAFLEVPRAHGRSLLSNFPSSNRYSGLCGESCHSPNSSACHRSMPPAPSTFAFLITTSQPHNRPRPTFHVHFQDRRRMKSLMYYTTAQPAPNAATYKGNGTTYQSTL